jgi:hypothetical protein
MRHGFGMTGVMLIVWTGILLARVVPAILRQRKAARREALAVGWPAVRGKVRGGSVTMADGRWRLTLSYDAFENGHGIELWSHDFRSKDEAEYTRRALIDRDCVVHCNSEFADDTTLLWSEVTALLADDPYVPQLIRLGRVGYRWLVGLAVVAVAGLSASVTLFGVAMWGSSSCVCEAMLALFFAAPVVLILSTVPMTRMMVVAPREGVWRRLGFVVNRWQRWAIGVALVGAVVSVAHFGPMFRALGMDADIPDRVFAGAVGVIAIPVFLYAAIVAVEGLRRLRPVEETVGVPTGV